MKVGEYNDENGTPIIKLVPFEKVRQAQDNLLCYFYKIHFN